MGEGDELLKDKVNSLVNQGQKKIVLNLAEVPYIDSAGLGEIVRTYTTVSRQGGSLKLLNLTKRITDLLSITKLLDRVRDIRLGGRGGPEFFGIGQGLDPSPALDGAQHFSPLPVADTSVNGYRAVRRRSELPHASPTIPFPSYGIFAGPLPRAPAGRRETLWRCCRSQADG